MITKRLFATSPTPAIQATLTTQEAILAAIQRAGSLNIGAIIRLHWWDPEGATAWLDYARSPRFSREAIDALPSLEQNARVVELWDAFGRYWRCLNVSPYGWARYRRLLEGLWGYPSYADGQDGWLGKLNTPYMNGRWGGAWRQRAHAAIYAPPAPQGNYSPAFGGNRSAFYTGNNNPEFGPTDVVFGTLDPYAIENAGNRPTERGTLPDRNFAPTVEVHRIWMQRTGAISGGYPRGLDRTYADTALVRPFARTLAEAWHTFNFSQPPTPNPGRWDDWTVGFALPNAGTLGNAMQWGAINRTQRASSTDVQWTVVPLLWYWEILRAAYPLTRGYGERATDPVTSSLLDYLANAGPDAVVNEVMADVAARNSAMADQQGFPLDRLGGAAELAEIDRQRRAAQPSTTTAILNGILTSGGGVVSLLTASRAPLAVAGAVSAAVNLLVTADDGYSAAEMRRTDVFGRLMPTLDTVGIVDSETSARQLIADTGLPSGATGGGGMALGGSVLLTALFGAGSGGLLTVVDMPHNGQVEVGQAREVPACRWADPALTRWQCTIPGGPQWVRVTSATGEARLARAEAGPFAPATVTWGAMYPEHRYIVQGLPPGADVFVDGTPAMGTWMDAGMTAWAVLLPTGPHAIRMIPPGGAPVLVEVMAQGAESAATWGQLVAAGAQQRQTAAQAATGGSVWPWLALAVALGAGGLFYATTQVSGGKRANPSGKRRRK